MLFTIINTFPWDNLLSALLYAIAGLMVFLFLFNRVLNQLRDGRIKKLVALALAVVCLPVPALAGLALARPWSLSGLAFPVLIFTLFAARELRLNRLGRERRGAPAVRSPGKEVSLAHPVTTTDLVGLHYTLPLPGWDGPAFRIAHLTDLHVNHKLPDSFYREAIEQVNQTEPDLIFITGDFISGLDGLPRLGRLLPGLRSRLGTYSVLGNHDYWAGAEQVLEVLRTSGITPLFNGCMPVNFEGHEILLSGCEDPFGPTQWQSPQNGAGRPLLVLAHTADSIYRLSQARASAVFTGHYHAGQIRLPWIGAIIIPSRYGRRFDQGHFVVRDSHLFVSAGVGAAAPAFRIYCQPDIQIVDFLPGKSV